MRQLILLLYLGTSIACDPGSEESFLQGRSLQPCLQNIPVCPDFFARCELNETTYAQMRFPDDSPFHFLVSALPEEEIEVTLYFVTQNDVGLSTNILWYEPGCSDVYKWKSEGLDIFAEAEDSNTFVRKERVYEGGDHPIEIDSDMRAIVDVTVKVKIPGTR